MHHEPRTCAACEIVVLDDPESTHEVCSACRADAEADRGDSIRSEERDAG
jgi:hypothetical protein